jgi:flavin reductase (DIM6/NTAB) family NADH-FMN oxidoreductase RutF
MSATASQWRELDLAEPIWERFFSVHPLVIVGTREPDGGDDLAPKHLVMPVSWDNYLGFVCSDTHATYRNVKREGAFTATYVRPSQTVLASLAATPRCEDGSKPIVSALPTTPALRVDGPLLADGYLQLECELHDIVEGLGANALILGRIVAARVDAAAQRDAERDDQDLLAQSPLLAYLHPGRFAEIDRSHQLPFPTGFRR